jgi:hypothetical protein
MSEGMDESLLGEFGYGLNALEQLDINLLS